MKHGTRWPRGLTAFALSTLAAAPVLAAGFLTLPPDPAAAAFPGRNGLIAFASNRKFFFND